MSPVWPARLQRVEVALVLVRAHDLDFEEHVRVVFAAQLGALAGVRALARRREGPVVVAPDVHVLLVEEVDDPEGVDHVARLELDLHGLVDRQVQRRQLADRRCPGRRSAAWTPMVQTVSVVGLAPLYWKSHAHCLPIAVIETSGFVVLRLEDRLVARREGEEADHEDQRHDRVEDLDRHVVAQLHREADLALAAAVDDRRPAHEAPRDDADDEQHDPGVDPQPGHHLGVVRGRRGALFEPGKEPVQLGRRAAGQDDGRCDPDGKKGPAETAFRGHDAPFWVEQCDSRQSRATVQRIQANRPGSAVSAGPKKRARPLVRVAGPAEIR